MPRRLLSALALALLCSLPAAAQTPDPAYWRLDDILDVFATWAVRYPDIVHLDTLGTSTLGEPIPLACIAAAPGTGRPPVFFHAAQHSNETNGTLAVMEQMRVLLEGYGLDPAVTARVDSLELWFAPVVNVDGYRYCFSGLPDALDWRKTLRDIDADGVVDFPDDGVDTNRNWDWQWDAYDTTDPLYYKGPHPFSEPEVTALRDFILERRPVLVVDYHSPVTISWTDCIFRNWISSSHGTPPDDAVIRDIALTWAGATQRLDGQDFSVWPAFDTKPKEQAWVYGNTGILSYLMEIGTHCWYAGADVDTVGLRVARGGAALTERVAQGPGLGVRVTDAATGAPLAAEVIVTQMHAADIGPRLASAGTGAAHRLLPAGAYTLRVQHPGFTTDERPVTVGSGWTWIDVALVRDATAVPASGRGTLHLRGRRPLTRGGVLALARDADVRVADVALYDLRGRLAVDLASGAVTAAAPVFALPPRLPAGSYLLRAVVDGRPWVRRVMVVE